MTRIELTQGYDALIAIKLVDQFLVKESLASADKATFAIRRMPSEAALLLKSTQPSGGLSINVAESTLEITIASAEVTAIPVGTYLGMGAVRFGSESAWYPTRQIEVVVRAKVGERV